MKTKLRASGDLKIPVTEDATGSQLYWQREGKVVYSVRCAGTSGHILRRHLSCVPVTLRPQTPQNRTGLPKCQDGARETTQERADQPKRGDLLSLYSKKPASLDIEATTERGTKLNESQC